MPRARVQKRLYYKIGEACKALGIQPYVLRYWETEFPALSPSKSRSGQRVYSEKELEVIRRIKELLYDEGYTIAGAKKKLETELASASLGETSGADAERGGQTAPPPPSEWPERPSLTPANGLAEPPAAAGGAAVRAARRTSPSPAVSPSSPPSAAPGGSVVDPAPGEPPPSLIARPEPPSGQLDTGAAQRIQRLRTGIQQALQEAREILALLDS